MNKPRQSALEFAADVLKKKSKSFIKTDERVHVLHDSAFSDIDFSVEKAIESSNPTEEDTKGNSYVWRTKLINEVYNSVLSGAQSEVREYLSDRCVTVSDSNLRIRSSVFKSEKDDYVISVSQGTIFAVYNFFNHMAVSELGDRGVYTLEASSRKPYQPRILDLQVLAYKKAGVVYPLGFEFSDAHHELAAENAFNALKFIVAHEIGHIMFRDVDIDRASDIADSIMDKLAEMGSASFEEAKNSASSAQEDVVDMWAGNIIAGQYKIVNPKKSADIYNTIALLFVMLEMFEYEPDSKYAHPFERFCSCARGAYPQWLYPVVWTHWVPKFVTAINERRTSEVLEKYT